MSSKNRAESSGMTADVVIVGAGMGGYVTARTLIAQLRRRGLKRRVLIIDTNNYCTFIPMLHEVLSGAVEPAHLAVPLRELVYLTDHVFLKASVQKIDPASKTVLTDKGVVRYSEYCVTALGSGLNYFGIPGTQEWCYDIRTLPMVRRLQRDFIAKLESGQKEVRLVIVGGGYTGVELAGNMGRYINRDLNKLYPGVTVTIDLIEAGPTILYSLPPEVQKKASWRLQREGVQIHCGQGVTEVRTDAVMVGGVNLPSDFTIWCSGVANTANQFFDTSWCEQGRIPVNEFLQSKNDERLFAVGDMVLGRNPNGTPYPQLGAAAFQEGEYVGRRIAALLAEKSAQGGSASGGKTAPFRFVTKGILIPVGKWYGIGVFGNWVVDGKAMWLLRCAVYVWFIPGWVRKIKITVDWLLHSMWFRYIILIERVGLDPARTEN